MNWTAETVAKALSDAAPKAFGEPVKSERTAVPEEANQFKLTVQSGEAFRVTVTNIRLEEEAKLNEAKKKET